MLAVSCADVCNTLSKVCGYFQFAKKHQRDESCLTITKSTLKEFKEFELSFLG